MKTEAHSLADVAEAGTPLVAGFGLITVIAAPFAVPILLLLALLALPLLPFALVGGLVAAVSSAIRAVRGAR
jgi:hypothetical protein